MASGGIKANQAGKVLEQQVVSLPPLGQDTVNESQDAACLRMHKAFYHPQVPDNASLRALSAEYESLKISWRKTSGYEYSKHVLVSRLPSIHLPIQNSSAGLKKAIPY